MRVNASSEQTYAARNKEVNDMATQIQEALITFTRERSLRKLKPNNLPKHVVLLDDQLAASLTCCSTKMSKKRKAVPLGRTMEHEDVDKKGMKNVCCVSWCCNTKNSQSVPKTPPSLKKKATTAHFVTHAKKVYVSGKRISGTIREESKWEESK
jgi:hypothetical protein